MGTMHRKRGKGTTSTFEDATSVEVVDLGEWGWNDDAMRMVRLISHKPLNPREAAQAIVKASPFVKEFKAQLLVTPGGFGEAFPKFRGSEIETLDEAVQCYVAEFLQFIACNRNFDIILGVDSQGGYIQDAYFLPGAACSIQECKRAWKSYPRWDEMYLYTKGRACQNRVVSSGRDKISLLVCHDMVAFSGRSQANRGQLREKWAMQMDSEVARGPNTGVVHLIHCLDSPSEGTVFTNGMAALISGGVTWGISTFKTKLYQTQSLHELREIEERTAKYTSPTLDLYVEVRK
ncbi:MAG: hypothetical protein GH152_00145 [Dehalococcoidia bacterium]|nr:hypothetical protein [Dehalococcoidia bacterium]